MDKLNRHYFRHLIPIAIILFIASGSGSFSNASSTLKVNYQQADKESCYCKGHRLYGRIQIVDKFPDLKVQIVTSFPDLKVKTVDYNPSRCGEWRMFDKFPDLKIQIVNSFPDLKIQFVQSFPGRTSSKLK
jgi:hypothetical protein